MGIWLCRQEASYLSEVQTRSRLEEAEDRRRDALLQVFRAIDEYEEALQEETLQYLEEEREAAYLDNFVHENWVQYQLQVQEENEELEASYQAEVYLACRTSW